MLNEAEEEYPAVTWSFSGVVDLATDGGYLVQVPEGPLEGIIEISFLMEFRKYLHLRFPSQCKYWYVKQKVDLEMDFDITAARVSS